MGNRGTEWGEWWQRAESGWERGESRWEWEESRWECGEWGENVGNVGNAGNQGRNAGNQGGIAGNRVGNAGNQDGNVVNQGGNTGNQGDSLWESSCLLLRLKSRSARGGFHHPAFMGSCLTISHTYFTLSTKWMSSPSGKWGSFYVSLVPILEF